MDQLLLVQLVVIPSPLLSNAKESGCPKIIVIYCKRCPFCLIPALTMSLMKNDLVIKKLFCLTTRIS